MILNLYLFFAISALINSLVSARSFISTAFIITVNIKQTELAADTILVAVEAFERVEKMINQKTLKKCLFFPHLWHLAFLVRQHDLRCSLRPQKYHFPMASALAVYADSSRERRF